MMLRILIASLALLAGVAAATQGAANAGLAGRIGLGSALLVNTTIVLAGAVVLFWALGARTEFFPRGAPWSLYLGGVCGLAVIVCMAIAFPRIGGAFAISLMVLGQSLAALAIDHFGLLGMPREPITLQRVAGTLLLTCGVALLRG
jgi:bacterial/archaeal transporter family-2 protein